MILVIIHIMESFLKLTESFNEIVKRESNHAGNDRSRSRVYRQEQAPQLGTHQERLFRQDGAAR